MGDIEKKLKYLEIDELSHLLLQKRSRTAPFDNKNWRESYYFNSTDERNRLSIITTIGILPNKGRSSGFVIVIHKGRVTLAKLLITRDIRFYETDRFAIKNLSYKVEGIDWRLGYRSGKCSFDLLFRPLNEFYPYHKEIGKRESNHSKMLFSQHIEQAGTFQGEMEIDGKKIKFGPTFGHRDHSWGIRDWASIDEYWLFSGTFDDKCAFNLWKGTSQGKPFQSGYFFDSKRNLRIRSSDIKGQEKGKLGEPEGSVVRFMDEGGKKHTLECHVVCSVPIPLPGSIVYETIARMKMDGLVGYGLLERHVNYSNPIHKLRILAALQKKRRGGP